MGIETKTKDVKSSADLDALAGDNLKKNPAGGGTWGFKDENNEWVTLPESTINEYMSDPQKKEVVLNQIISRDETEGQSQIPKKPDESAFGSLTKRMKDNYEAGGDNTQQVWKEIHADADRFSGETSSQVSEEPQIKEPDVTAVNFERYKDQQKADLLKYFVQEVGFDPLYKSSQDLFIEKWDEIKNQTEQDVFGQMFPDEVYEYGFGINGDPKREAQLERQMDKERKAFFKNVIVPQHKAAMDARNKAFNDQEKGFKKIKNNFGAETKEQQKSLTNLTNLHTKTATLREMRSRAEINGDKEGIEAADNALATNLKLIALEVNKLDNYEKNPDPQGGDKNNKKPLPPKIVSLIGNIGLSSEKQKTLTAIMQEAVAKVGSANPKTLQAEIEKIAKKYDFDTSVLSGKPKETTQLKKPGSDKFYKIPQDRTKPNKIPTNPNKRVKK